MKTKWIELEKLDLNGYVCYMRKSIKNKPTEFLYYFQKEVNKKYISVVSTFENIEFCLLHEISLTEKEINKLV